MGFLRQRKDGTTSLAILTPCDSGKLPGTSEVPVTLGTIFYLLLEMIHLLPEIEINCSFRFTMKY